MRLKFGYPRSRVKSTSPKDVTSLLVKSIIFQEDVYVQLSWDLSFSGHWGLLDKLRQSISEDRIGLVS